MTPTERRASQSLALVYLCRMLGLFMVLPVFALEARHYPGGESSALIGLALGAYGLVQACFQIPFGLAADRFGRKRVILIGLCVFLLGSILGAVANHVLWLGLARALQGAGAISAAVTALLADLTRDEVRTKGMALVGISIGLAFMLSLVVGPLLVGLGGLPAVFQTSAALALLAMWAIWRLTPAEPKQPRQPHSLSAADFFALLQHADLLRLNLGVFVLYAVQIATWVAVPPLLLSAGVSTAGQAWVYLPAVLLSFVILGAGLFRMERKGWLKPVFLSCLLLVMAVQLAWAYLAHAQGLTPSVWNMGLLLFMFFCGFNVLEATQPSLASRWAPVGARGATLGVYNTLQSLGIFAGGALGGWLSQTMGFTGLFLVNASLLMVWLLTAWGMSHIPGVNPSKAV